MEAEITVTEPTEATTAIGKMEVWAGSLVIQNQEQRDFAVQAVKGAAKWRKTISEWFADSKTKAHAAWKAIVAQETGLTSRIDAAERKAKAVIMAWDAEQERIRREEQARLQAIADAEARREAERLRKEAERLKTPELKAERLEMAEAVVSVAVQVAAPVKVAGEVTSTVWRAELTSIEALVKAAANGNKLALSFLEFNQATANKCATANRDAVPVPGVAFIAKKQMSFR
jgi:hypothetical protein